MSPLFPTVPVLLVGVLTLLGVGSGCRRNDVVTDPAPTVRVLGPADVENREGRLWVKNAPAGSGTNAWFTGLLREVYPDGKVRAEALVQDGRMQGLTRGFYPSGAVQMEENFVQGVSHGVRRRFYEDGTLKALEEIRNGRLHGRYERYHPNGTPAERGTYRDGLPEGIGESWDAAGKLLARVEFEAGRVVDQKFMSDAPGGLVQETSRP